MKLITKALAGPLMAAYNASAENGGGANKPVIVKFFTPWASATWFISEGMPVDASGEPTSIENAVDWHLFGFCDLGDRQNAELGYVMLSDLEGLKGPFGLKVERDLYSNLGTLDSVMAKYGREAA